MDLVKTVPTSEPNSLKFELSFNISTRKAVYESPADAMNSPIASKLFGFPWTAKVEVSENWVILTKQEWVDWDVLESPLIDLFNEHFKGSEEKQLEENPVIEKPDLNFPFAQQVQAVLDQEVNPAVAQHGGHISLIDVKDTKIFIRLEGGCQGCGMASATVREGVETLLKERFTQIESVVDVTDHAGGVNPYMR